MLISLNNLQASVAIISKADRYFNFFSGVIFLFILFEPCKSTREAIKLLLSFSVTLIGITTKPHIYKYSRLLLQPFSKITGSLIFLQGRFTSSWYLNLAKVQEKHKIVPSNPNTPRRGLQKQCDKKLTRLNLSVQRKFSLPHFTTNLPCLTYSVIPTHFPVYYS